MGRDSLCEHRSVYSPSRAQHRRHISVVMVLGGFTKTSSRTGVGRTFSAHPHRPPFDRRCTSREQWSSRIEQRDECLRVCRIYGCDPRGGNKQARELREQRAGHEA
jgi:hypothetical protein